MQGHGRIIAPDFCVAHREANSGLSTLNRAKSILSIYHQQRQLQKQRGMCLNDTYPFCQQPLSGNCHSICFLKPVLWTATPGLSFFDVRMSYLAAIALLASAISWKMPACFLLTIALMTSRVATIRMQAMIKQMTTFWIRPARMKLTKVTPETVRA